MEFLLAWDSINHDITTFWDHASQLFVAVEALDSFAEEFYHCGRLIRLLKMPFPYLNPFHSITPV